jgi:hypothetical protein
MRANMSQLGGLCRAWLPALGLAVVGAVGCGEDFAVVPVRNLERPSDLGFACLAVLDTPGGQVISGRPMAYCHDPEKADPRADLSARVIGTFGLATNTARGELAAIDFDLAEYRVSPLLDLDLRNPGFNQLPVGSLPEVISMSDDGCRAVTANRGSCDLSLVDLPRLFTPQFSVKTPSTGEGPVSTHVRFKIANREVRTSPFEIAFLPTGPAVTTQAEARDTTKAAPACHADGVARAGMTPIPWRALVTFPACDLVAMVNLPSGDIVSGVRIQAGGVVTEVTPEAMLDCPVECPAPAAGSALLADAAGPLGVGALAITPEGDRAYVGAARSAFITALEITPDGLRKLPDDGRVPLAEEPGGVTRLRLSYSPYAPSTPLLGQYAGMRGKFLYAFARDGSIRVVDLNRTPGGRERECDVNVDPDALLRNVDAPCYPVSERRPRRLLASGPGLRIPVSEQPEVAPPVPVDIAFAQVGMFPTGLLLASNGQIYHVSIDGSVSVGERTVTLPHNFRRVGSGQGSAAGGDPNVVSEPERQFTANGIPFPTRVGFNSRLDGPRMETFVESTRTQYVAFPRPYASVPEDFGVNWEGTLPGTDRDAAQLSAAGPQTVALTDLGADFCRAGVEEGDIVAFLGCETDEDCDPGRRGLEVCHRASPGAQGVCLTKEFIADEERLRLCRPELSSRRRYEVREVFKNRLTFGVRLDEVPRPKIYPCQNDVVCQPDAAHQPGTTSGDQGFQCLNTAAGEQRCLKTCGERAQDGSWTLNDRLCRAGHICADVGEPALGPLCVEAPPPRPECLPLQLSYRVQAGKAFLLSSSALPYLASRREDPANAPGGGRCVPDPARNPLHGQRISLSAPHCKGIVDGPEATADRVKTLTPEAEAGGWGNACLFRGPNGDASGGQEHIKALFENPTVRFIFTNIEQYVGDAANVFVTIEGGFSPLRVRPTRQSVEFRMGTRIVTAPMDSIAALGESTEGAPPPYIFVVDQGRTSTSLSRGQILRVNPRSSTVFPGGYIDSPDINSLFPIQ